MTIPRKEGFMIYLRKENLMYNHQLDTFIVVADSGSFNKAAEALFISPPAVIKQINLLEDSLGVRLFTRTHRGLQLTKAGQSVYEDARYIIAYCRESVERAKKADDTQPSVLRIGTSTMTPGQTIVDMWTQIREEIPDIKFQLVPFENTPENAREILKNMGKNIDIVCGVYDERALKNWQCAAQFVADVPMRCAVSVYDPLAKKDRLTVEDLHGRSIMLIREGWNEETDRLRKWLTEEHPEINIVTFDFINLSVFNDCENSDHVLMCIDMWSNVHPLLKTLPVDWDYSMPFGLLHSPKPCKTVKRFLNAVKHLSMEGIK